MEHLALEIFDLADGKTSITALGSQYANLPEDASITITDTSEIFDSGNVWSYSFTLNIPANLHIFGTSGDIHGSRLHEQIDKRRARLWVEGLPLYLGYLRLGDEAEVDEDGNVDVTFESGQHTFDDMIEGAKANQVPMMDDVLIGMALWRKRWTRFKVRLQASVPLNEEITMSGSVTHPATYAEPDPEVFTFEYDGEGDDNSVQEYPRMVFPKGDFIDEGKGYAEPFNLLNTDYPYDDGHPYCNVALCYQKYGYRQTDEDGNVRTDYSAEPVAERGYEYMPANRVNSAPNFYVIYWIRALMKHLGIYIEENQMMGVQDLRRLFFVNTNTAYEEPKKLRTVAYNSRYGRYRSGGSGRLVPEYIDPKRNVSIDESGFSGKNARVVSGDLSGDITDKVSIKISEIFDWSDSEKNDYISKNSYFHKAYATSECFPNVDISEVISAIENGFGVRFLFSDNYQRVRIVLLRNIFRSKEVQEITCDIVDEPTKTENSIRGFRMTYGDSEDTHFYYKGFADMLPHKKELWVDNSDTHDYSHWNLNADYAKLINKVSAFDKTCYVDPATGNAYGIKIDKDAKRYDQLHPSLFGFAGFMDAEDGDCTGEEATIETVSVGFTPAIMNDLNMNEERKGSKKQQFALFVDETMRSRRPDLKDGEDYNNADAVYNPDRLYRINSPYSSMTADDGIVKLGEFAVMSDMYASKAGNTAIVRSLLFFSAQIAFNLEGHINEGYRLYLQDNYEPNDDGVAPVETHDWGLMLGIMRGSGSDMYVDYSADPDDGEGNDTWEIVSGSSVTAHPDTCDDYGSEWDYNGSEGRGVPVTTAEIEYSFWQTFGYHVQFNTAERGYVKSVIIMEVRDSTNTTHRVLVVSSWSTGATGASAVIDNLQGHHIGEIYDNPIVIDVDTDESRKALVDGEGGYIEQYEDALANGGSTTIIDNGIGSREGRFSLKLRAEKPNPYFDPKQPENDTTNRRYLKITDENLRQRGLCDQFYKEYSKFIREARIANLPVRMELAQLLAIDKTKRTTVGDITGFIRKMQFTVSNKTGLGDVKMEMMYI